MLAWPLERMLGDAVDAWPGREGVDAVVPVPTTSARLRERGFHLAEILAAAAARRLGCAARTAWLARPGDPTPQAALPRTERRRAARGTVALRPGFGPFDSFAPLAALSRTREIEGKRVLVVDDVLTTGATVKECARVLLDAGAEEVRVAVAARA